MRQDDLSQTIIAVSTAAGAAPVAILRISGSEAEAIVCRLFQSGTGEAPRQARTYTTVQGSFLILVADNPSVLRAETVAVPANLYIMRAPYSYTREDVFEVHTVGCPPLLQLILAAFIKAGARLAGPGEFTRRAFLNGRLDLARAESVMAIVRSRTESDLRAATLQLQGALGDAIRRVRDELSDLCALSEAALDFSDQDIQILPPGEMSARLRRLGERLNQMGQRPHHRAPDEAITVVIAGKPNVGKSSLLNALVERYGASSPGRRAIVSHIPGTTRDTVEARIAVQGIEFRLLDTAGLCETEDEVEARAVERAKTAHELANLRLQVLAATDMPGAPCESVPAEHHTLVVVNKADLAPHVQCPKEAIFTSVVSGQGIELLARRMADMVFSGRMDRSGSAAVTNARQQEALDRARRAIQAAAGNLDSNTGIELAAFEMRAALDTLGEIVGEVTTEDVLDKIFGQFCIGK